MKSYILNIHPVEKSDRSFCFQGLALTISSIIELSDKMFNEFNDLFFIYTNKFNQDPIENHFSKIRCRNFNKKNPSVSEFGALFAKIL